MKKLLFIALFSICYGAFAESTVSVATHASPVFFNAAINQMNEEEIYEHTINMIIGIDITLQSQICVCEYSSNVARFIKLAHHNSNNVYNIIKPDEDINWDSTLCPCYDEFL